MHRRRLGQTNDDAQSRLWRTSTWIVINCRLQRDDAIFSGVLLVGRNPKVAPTRETSPGELPGNSPPLSLSLSLSHPLEFLRGEFRRFLTRARRERDCKFNAAALRTPQVHRKRNDAEQRIAAA